MQNNNIAKQEIQAFYRNNKYGWIGSLVLFIALLFIMKVDFTPLLIMYIALLIPYLAFHITNQMMFERAVNEPTFNVKTWRFNATAVSLYIGLLIGSLPVKYLDLSHSGLTFLVTTILIMSMFGSSVITAPCKRVHFAWGIISTTPITILLILADNVEYNIMGWMIVFTGIPVGVALNFYNYKTLHESIKLRFENIELIEEVNQAKEKAETANSDKSRFLAASSHDLRQPLHALDLFLGALASTALTDEQKQLLTKASHSSHSLIELLNALMDISNMDAGNTVINKESFNIRVHATQLVNEFQPLLKNSAISIQLNCCDKNIYSDKLLLSRIIRNLIVNAINHSHAQHLYINVHHHDKQIQIEIEDDGIGIAETEQKNIYSESYQIHNTERDRNKGLGLGLAIVKRLCQLLGHTIQLQSEEDKGCRFIITVPIAVAENIPVTPVSPSDNDISGSFVLVIDDDNEVAEAMRTLLKQWGCELLVGDSLATIEAELDGNHYPPPDLLLIDYRLKNRQTGVQAVSALRQYFNQTTPAIIITGDTGLDIIEKINRSDCSLLNKPVSSDVLKQAIFDSIHRN